MSTQFKEPKQITTHKGRYPWESSLIMQLCEANALLKQANAIIQDYTDTLGYGEVHVDCEYWLLKHQSYLDERVRVLETGDDWRKGQ